MCQSTFLHRFDTRPNRTSQFHAVTLRLLKEKAPSTSLPSNPSLLPSRFNNLKREANHSGITVPWQDHVTQPDHPPLKSLRSNRYAQREPCSLRFGYDYDSTLFRFGRSQGSLPSLHSPGSTQLRYGKSSLHCAPPWSTGGNSQPRLKDSSLFFIEEKGCLSTCSSRSHHGKNLTSSTLFRFGR